jgi:hypothetical protein
MRRRTTCDHYERYWTTQTCDCLHSFHMNFFASSGKINPAGYLLNAVDCEMMKLS